MLGLHNKLHIYRYIKLCSLHLAKVVQNNSKVVLHGDSVCALSMRVLFFCVLHNWMQGDSEEDGCICCRRTQPPASALI